MMNCPWIQVADLDWRQGVNCVFHIADAPCHGLEFHDEEDSHPDGTEHKAPAVLAKIAQKGVDLYCLRLNSACDKMFSKFTEYFDHAVPPTKVS